ncbi:MAG: hypothetical protein ACE5PV_23665 [Candidatus Poribacteria bacterium]
MDKTLFMLLIGISIFSTINLAYGQMTYEPHPRTGFSGVTGLTMIELVETEDGELTPFYRLQLRPEINLDRIGVGFDGVLLYNPDEGVRAESGEEWNFGNYLRAIRYFRYGHRRESLYFVYGALENMSIGHGLIMGGYSNYDRRGLRFDVNTSLFGAETILNNLAEPSIFGGRIYLRPFHKSDISPLINRLTFGATYITDIDPDPKSDSEDPLATYSLDLNVPIIKALGLEVYNELAFLRGLAADKTGIGNAVGTGMEFLNANFKIEYRIFNKYFQPTPFDYTYEASKPLTTIVDEGTGLQRGIYSLLAYYLPGKIRGAIAYENYTFGHPNLYGEIVETGLIDRMSLRAFYVKHEIEDFSDIFDLDEKSALTIRIGFEVYPPLEFIVLHKFRFREREDKEGFETIRETSFELGINMQF